jgi:hypothetical protein
MKTRTFLAGCTALLAVCLAAPVALAAGEYTFAKDVNYSKVLFCVDLDKRLRKIKDMKQVAQRNKMVASHVRGIQESFLPALKFMEGRSTGRDLLKEAKENRVGFVLQATIKDLEGCLEQQMHVFARGMWRQLYKVKTVPGLEDGVSRHPAEVPFFEAMLPLHVAQYEKKSVREKYEDGSSLMCKRYKCTFQVKNNLPFKVTKVSLCYHNVVARKTSKSAGKAHYRSIVKDVPVSIEPGATGEFKKEETKFPHSVEFDNARKALVYGVAVE